MILVYRGRFYSGIVDFCLFISRIFFFVVCSSFRGFISCFSFLGSGLFFGLVVFSVILLFLRFVFWGLDVVLGSRERNFLFIECLVFFVVFIDFFFYVSR